MIRYFLLKCCFCSFSLFYSFAIPVMLMVNFFTFSHLYVMHISLCRYMCVYILHDIYIICKKMYILYSCLHFLSPLFDFQFGKFFLTYLWFLFSDVSNMMKRFGKNLKTFQKMKILQPKKYSNTENKKLINGFIILDTFSSSSCSPNRSLTQQIFIEPLPCHSWWYNGDQERHQPNPCRAYNVGGQMPHSGFSWKEHYRVSRKHTKGRGLT